MKLVRRISNGELYEASFPEGFDGNPMEPGYYFRHVIPSGKRWWQFWKPRFIRTGAIWETDEESTWDVVVK